MDYDFSFLLITHSLDHTFILCPFIFECDPWMSDKEEDKKSLYFLIHNILCAGAHRKPWLHIVTPILLLTQLYFSFCYLLCVESTGNGIKWQCARLYNFLHFICAYAPIRWNHNKFLYQRFIISWSGSTVIGAIAHKDCWRPFLPHHQFFCVNVGDGKYKRNGRQISSLYKV